MSSLYPDIDHSTPHSKFSSSSTNMYPSVEISDLAENLFPDNPQPPSSPPLTVEDTVITIPGAIVHLIDQTYSVELACGDFSLVKLRQGDNVVAIIARVSNELQWPLIKEESIVKVDDSHYFFSISDVSSEKVEDVLNYGLSFASKGQEELLAELDSVFEGLGNFTVQCVAEEVVGEAVAREMTPEEVVVDEEKREDLERSCGAYWTTLAPNVEDYSTKAARLIASGSGKMIKGILWCGDVTVDRLNWGHEVLRKRIVPGETREIDKSTLDRIKRVKSMTKMTNKVAKGVLTGVVRVSGFFTSSVANSKPGKKFFSLLPGEIVLASLDGFNRICDAAEVAGKEVMSTTSTVTTRLVTHKYGEEAGKATHEGLGAAGHAIGTAWTVFKVRKALNPKSSLKPTSLAKTAAKAAAAGYKSRKSSK